MVMVDDGDYTANMFGENGGNKCNNERFFFVYQKIDLSVEIYK